ncbi:hypothetical protein LCGC14_0821240 [marine sediment metagenome]|uniref:Uncharacterized protein n=1 Tax=marine sediment metagenome TaxID=412755 RepID=A0A0F9S3M4_9ZZZZ
MEYDLAQFEKNMEEIFAPVSSPHKKVVMCGRCGDTVAASDGDCTCGYIGRIMRQILKRLEPEPAAVFKKGGGNNG